MLTPVLLVPLLAAALLALSGRLGEAVIRRIAIAAASVPLLLLVGCWLRFDPEGPLFQLVTEVAWIPTLGVAFRLGIDGIALALAGMSTLLFLAAIAWPADTGGRPHAYYAWLLFLEAVSLGVFLALDLLLFYVFFDLSLVGMYFLIGRWGHGDARRSALKFFLYTLVGSLAFLLALIGLVLARDPITFDMRALIDAQPLAGAGLRAGLVFLGFVVGFGIKTPLVPFHTWLPPAHVDAPAPASTILAGVLLKLGTFGLVRIPLMMMAETFARYAVVVGAVAVVSIVYGALVALGQSHIKRRIAYTSVNHMGYTVLGIASAAALAAEAPARAVALTGATVEMVAHGLITGSLFLVTGVFWSRAEEYEMDAYGGLARRAPRLAVLTTLAAFASLGLPGLAGFVAEFQIFAGTFAVFPLLAAIGLLGILITAALFLQLLQRVFLGEPTERWSNFADLGRTETITLAVLAVLIVLIGVYPAWLLDVIHAAATAIVGAG